MDSEVHQSSAVNRQQTEEGDRKASNETNEKNVEEYVSQYLKSHPVFAEQWFKHHLSSRCEISDNRDVSADQSKSTRDTTDGYARQRLTSGPQIGRQISDAIRKNTEDEESLTASYVEMAREGRNSVTFDLFRDFVDNGRKKNNSNESGL